MTNILNYFKLSTNVLVGIGIFAIVAIAMLVSVPQAKAAEFPDILANQNMTVGPTGQGVVVLQGLMTELGYLNVPSGIPFGYFGSLTKAAVAKYQASNNVYPAIGFFGPVTKLAMYDDFSNHGWLSMLGWK